MTDILPKMSIKTLGGNPKMASKAENEPSKTIPMCRILGVARGIKAAVGNDGDPVFGLTGQFEGTNVSDGKVYSSGVLYLPSGIQELIQDPLEAAINEGDKTAAVSFALDLFAVSASNKAGYSFTATRHADADLVDPFKALRAAVADVPALKLEAPKDEKAKK